jgi:hypothetical protein
MRSQAERQNEVKPILLKLKELHLNPTAYASIKTLYQQLQVYIQQGERIELNIPFPEYNVTIKGVLAIENAERVWVKLEPNKA